MGYNVNALTLAAAAGSTDYATGAFRQANSVRQKVVARLRSDYSPRHVPDQIFQVDEIPYTLTGKKMEVPVRKVLTGYAPEQAANRDAMANPRALDEFARFAAEMRPPSNT